MEKGVTNYLPFSPELVSTALNVVIQTTTSNLQWTASDVDTSDSLTYDVYFGTDQTNLAIKSEDQIATSFETPTLAVSTPYYWKVVVKDRQGDKLLGEFGVL